MHKKGAPKSTLSCLVDVGLEGELCGQLHRTSVVGELLVRPVEEGVADGLEVVARGVAGRVDVVNGSGDVLSMVEEVEGSRTELEGVVLVDRKPLLKREVNVIDRTDGKRITCCVGVGTRAALDVVGIGVDGRIADQVAVARRCRRRAVSYERGVVDSV